MVYLVVFLLLMFVLFSHSAFGVQVPVHHCISYPWFAFDTLFQVIVRVERVWVVALKFLGALTLSSVMIGMYDPEPEAGGGVGV